MKLDLSLLKHFLLITGLLWLSNAFATDSVAATQNEQSVGLNIPYPALNYGTSEHKAQVERGEYLVRVGDCISCHTDSKNKGQPFAGGLAIDTPFGVIYSPNITPDKETGIGNWSDEDFFNAMHKGKAPDGSNYFPVFPYTSFSHVSEDDIHAIKAYLFALQPVSQKNKEPDMPWPFRVRFLQYGWKILFFYPHNDLFQPDPSQSAQWNRGAYLVQGLGHCGECHTPRNFLGAMKTKQYLGGAFIESYYAPNITSYGVKSASEADIVNVFVHGKMLTGGGQVQGPMAEVNSNSLKYLSREDLEAIAVYLKTVKAVEPPKNESKATAGSGKKIYNSHCAVCHDTGAAGAPKLGDNTAWQPRIELGMDTLYNNAINGLNSMPPKGTCLSCSDDEIKASVDYIVENSQPGKTQTQTIPSTQPAKPTRAQAKQIYDKVCSVCHANGGLGAPKFGDHEAWDPLVKQGMDVLFERTLKGYKAMPVKGGCLECSDSEVMSAVKYMVDESTSEGDYELW